MEIATDIDKSIDRFTAALIDNFELVKCEVKHTFTDDQYIRTILMKEGEIVVSKIHNTRHPYFVLEGMCDVFIPGKGWETIQAPYAGITEPGTRRILVVWEDCVWSTVHAMREGESVNDIEDRIIDKRDNDFLTDEEKKAIEDFYDNEENQLKLIK